MDPREKDLTNSLKDRFGLMLVFEGIDGTGKSTQCKLLAQKLKECGFQVIQTREPTDSIWGKKLREKALKGKRFSPKEELDLFIKDRKQHLENVILPSLKKGIIVVQDRYYFSTMAYQGSKGIDPKLIEKEHHSFAPLPNRTFLLQLKPKKALERIQETRDQKADAWEQIENLEKCHHIFQNLVVPGLIKINADQDSQRIHEEILEEVSKLCYIPR